MNIHGLLKNYEFRWVDDAVAAASNTDANSAIIDMSGYESALFVTTITDSTETGVATLKIEGNSTNADSGMALITGASAAATSAADDDLNNKLLIVEVRNPGYEYIQAVRTSATANIAFGEVMVFLKPMTVPVTQGATVQASAFVSD